MKASATHNAKAFFISIYVKKFVPALFVILFMVLILIRPSYYIQSASRGLALFATTVLPALFPFFFCSTLLTKIGAAKALSSLGAKPLRVLFNAPPEGAYVFVLSVLSGYPVGAAMLSDLYGSGALDEEEVKKISSFTSTSGPIFILGTVGSVIFDNAAAGLVILAAHYLSAILNGLIYRGRKGAQNRASQLNILDSDNALAESISSSTLAMLAVGGYIVLTNMLIDTVSLTGLPALLSGNLPPIPAGTFTSLIYGVFEMTRGSMEARIIPYMPLSVACAAAIVSFGGLSVILQSFTFLSRCKMNLGQLLIRKLTQCIFAFSIAFFMAFFVFN